MRAVFVNHCHPETPHVCAVRLREFARAMAARGHRIVLLTATLRDDDPGADPRRLGAALAAHDWSDPFGLACRPAAAPLTHALQHHRLPTAISKPVVAWCYLVKGGVFWTWTTGSRPFWPALADAFAPEIVWASFGNVDALDIARGIAAAARCPWAMDVKDPWDVFVPRPLRATVATRYRKASALTALSETHLSQAVARFSRPGTVLYSGITEERLTGATGPSRPDGVFRLVLSGGTYDRCDLDMVIAAVGDWLRRPGAPQPGRVALIYAGGDHRAVGEAAQNLAGRCRLDIRRFVAPDMLAALQDAAGANLYVKGRDTPFHHKLIELLAAGRPVICLPPDTPEAARLAAVARVPFFGCADRAAVIAALEAAFRLGCAAPTVDRAALARYTWPAQAMVLEQVLADAIARSRR